jgi:hypothetical protein
LSIGHAARDGGAVGIGEVRVGAVMAGVDGGAFQAGAVEHIAQAHASPFRAANAAEGPLVAGGARAIEAPAVAGALDGKTERRRFELALQLGDGEIERIVDFAVDAQTPIGVAGAADIGRRSIVAHEEALGRRHLVVEQMRRRF